MIRNNEIVTCRANKGGKIVLITHGDYKAVMNTQLEKFERVPVQAENLQAYFNEVRPDCEKMLINLFENGCISHKACNTISLKETRNVQLTKGKPGTCSSVDNDPPSI